MSATTENIIRIPPTKYIHVLDNNSNVSRLEVGPATYIRKEHEKIVAGPLDMVRLPPRYSSTSYSSSILLYSSTRLVTNFELSLDTTAESRTRRS